MAKLRISERNTKEKLVFLFIPEREELRQAQSYEKSRAKQKNLYVALHHKVRIRLHPSMVLQAEINAE